MRIGSFLWRCALVTTALCVGCGGPHASALSNPVFYDEGADGVQDLGSRFERAFPPLNLVAAADGSPTYLGVTILEGAVRVSRPATWRIRSASNEPGRRFIEYVSPQQYVTAVYERAEDPAVPWHEILRRYEADTLAEGATIIGKAAPSVTWNAQARVYDVRRAVDAPRRALVSYSREYLVRSDNRVVLIQVVHPGKTLQPIVEEVLRVVQTLQVL